MFCNFSLKLNMANHTHLFLAPWPRKRRNTLNKRKTKFASTCNVQKVIRGRSDLEVVKNPTIHFFFQNCWYSLIASPISFNLIQGFRYLQFKLDALHCLYATNPWRCMVTLKPWVCFWRTTKFQWSVLQNGEDSSIYILDIILGWVYDIINIILFACILYTLRWLETFSSTFQDLEFDGSFITTLYLLTPTSWYQQTVQSSGNKLLLILWHNRLP